VKEHPVIIESSSEPAPVFGRDGEPCPACGAPLAGDQRYCLHCGVRRPEARLEFLDVLDADVRARSVLPPPGATAAPFGYAAAAAPPPSGLNGRLQANSGLLALATLLLLTLLIGLLVGHWATGSSSAPSAAAPAPQVIRVEGGGTAAPAAAAATTGGGASGGGSSAKSAKSRSSSKSSTSSDKTTTDKSAVSVKSLSSKKAVEDAVKKGKPISTGTGKLPAKDDKAPAGGSSFEEIG
jgi:hypothetical protein